MPDHIHQWPTNPPNATGLGFGDIRDTELLRWFQYIPGLRSLMVLRQVHALEHGTVSLLGGKPPATATPTALWDWWKTFTLAEPLSPSALSHPPRNIGGITTEAGFYLYGNLRRLDIVRAVRDALDRLTQGEWQLAIHPHCSTTWPVPILLQSGLTLGLHLLLPKTPIEQFLGVSLAATMATELAPEAEAWWQRYIMTAIPFNLEIVDIQAVTDEYGTPAHFVQVQWVEAADNA